MASKPLAPRNTASDLETSTAMTSVTPDDLDHAAKQAATMVENVARTSNGGASKARRGRKSTDPREGPPERPTPTATFEAAAPTATFESDARTEEFESDARTEDRPDPAFEAVEANTVEVSDKGAGEPVPAVSNGIAAAADAAASIPAETSTSADALARFNAKAAEAMRANIEDAFAFWTSMMKVRSLSEALALHAQHTRRQMEALATQGRELSSLAQKLAVDTLGQFKPTQNKRP